MKKLLLGVMVALFAFSAAYAQPTSLFSETFSTNLAGRWTLINNDGLTPASGVSWVNDAWVWDNNSHIGAGQIAVSTSWYNPAGAADDWMISPQIIVPAGDTNVVVVWYAAAYSSSYPDGYQVKVAPNGGNTIADFTTNLTTVAHENGGWTQRVANLTAYAGDTIRLAWRNNSNDEYMLLVDNIQVIAFLPDYDLNLQTADLYSYVAGGATTPIVGTIENMGFKAVTSFVGHYSVDGGPDVAETFNIAALATFGTKTFTFSTECPIPNGVHQVKVWTSDINGNHQDQDPTNDSITHTAFGVNNTVNKKVLVEEFTGAWCGFCPDGGLKMEEIVENASSYAIPVAIHWGSGTSAPDGMQVSEGVTVSNTYSIGYPSACIDRVFYLDQSDVAMDRASNNSENLWIDYANQRVGMVSPVNVSLNTESYDSATRKLTVTVKGDFSANLKGDYRFNLYVIEDSVTGTGTNFDQHNYYSSALGTNGVNDPSSPLYNLPEYITGYEHRHVVRKMLGGSWGTASVIPSTVDSGSSYSKTYTYTLPGTINEQMVSIVGLVQEYQSDIKYRNVLNSEDMKLIQPAIDTTADTTHIDTTHTGIRTVKQGFQNVFLYPNPVKDQLKVQFELTENTMLSAVITNVVGQKVADVFNGQLNSGIHTIPAYTANLQQGVYFITMRTGSGGTITRRFVITR